MSDKGTFFSVLFAGLMATLFLVQRLSLEADLRGQYAAQEVLSLEGAGQSLMTERSTDEEAKVPLRIRVNIIEEIEKHNISIVSLIDSRGCVPDSTKLRGRPIDSWRTLEPRLSYVYSAYYDERFKKSDVIRVFGIANRERMAQYDRLPYYCQAWPKGKDAKPVVTQALCMDILSRRFERFREMVFLCPFPKGSINEETASHIALVSRPCGAPHHGLSVHYPPKGATYKETFTVCLAGPLKLGYSNTSQFVQWMELSTMFGAERIIMYNHSSGRALDPYTEYYTTQKDVDMLPWHLPPEVDEELDIWNLAQLVMINDCLWRATKRSKYVLFMDLDEMIVPRHAQANTWGDVLRQSECENQPYITTRNVFFRTVWPDDELYEQGAAAQQLKLTFLLKYRRETLFWAPKLRSKYFVRPEWIHSLIVHHANLNDERVDSNCVVSPDVAALHHYRSIIVHRCDNITDDRTLQNFGTKLIESASKIHQNVKRLSPGSEVL